MAPDVLMKKPDWGKRIRRAIELAELHPSCAEVLVFYQHILDFQKALSDDISLRPAPTLNTETSFRKQLDIDVAAQRLPALLSLVQKKGPSKLAQEAATIGGCAPEQQREMLRSFMQAADNDSGDVSFFYARVLFQPHAEHLAATQATRLVGFGGSVCPVCGARPQVAVLRPEGVGGKHFLVCSFCLTEWEFRRILCPICEEEHNAQLPRYSADEFLAVRVEACDTCKYYLKSVDMTVDGLAVPMVDEVATVPLDVWAVEHGYKKIEPNIMGF